MRYFQKTAASSAASSTNQDALAAALGDLGVLVLTKHASWVGQGLGAVGKWVGGGVERFGTKGIERAAKAGGKKIEALGEGATEEAKKKIQSSVAAGVKRNVAIQRLGQLASSNPRLTGALAVGAPVGAAGSFMAGRASKRR
jgi:hypothetical protein